MVYFLPELEAVEVSWHWVVSGYCTAKALFSKLVDFFQVYLIMPECEEFVIVARKTGL